MASFQAKLDLSRMRKRENKNCSFVQSLPDAEQKKNNSEVMKNRREIYEAHECKVLKPGPDCMVQPEKPRTTHFCSSFSLKNRSMGKKQGSVRTTVRPHGFKNHEWFSQFSQVPLKKKKIKALNSTILEYLLFLVGKNNIHW